MSRTLTQEIFKEDCVGDSSAKHNYNLLSLDSSICNLSSQYFTVKNNYFQIFSDFISNTSIFVQSNNLFNNPNRYNLVSATVNLLSSYWAKHEFSVHYPLNISLLNNLQITCPTTNLPDTNLISLAKTYLNNNYPATKYDANTFVNVVFFLYNVPSNPNDPNDLISKSFSPEISYVTRHMYVNFNKQDVHLANGKIFKFSNDGNGKWVYYSTDTGSTQATGEIILVQTKPPRIITKPTTSNGRSTINLVITDNTHNFDVYYNTAISGLYYPGYTDVTVTVNAGVYVGATSTSNSAITVSGFSTGDTVTIVNNGNIFGCGGAGGLGEGLGTQLSVANNGSNGGDAIFLAYPTTIQNNGIIAGGGGGGAGGIASHSNTSYAVFHSSTGVQSALVVAAGSGGGGGGGGGYDAGLYGSVGTYTVPITPPGKTPSFSIHDGSIGNSGGLTTGGSGGSGWNPVTNTGSGGNGGNIGLPGVSTGTVDVRNTQYPPLGGKAGNYVNGHSYITWLQTGDVRGNLA